MHSTTQSVIRSKETLYGEESDEDSSVEDCLGSGYPVILKEVYQRQSEIHSLQHKCNIFKKVITTLQCKIKKLEDLNTRYQEHMLKCVWLTPCPAHSAQNNQADKSDNHCVSSNKMGPENSSSKSVAPLVQSSAPPQEFLLSEIPMDVTEDFFNADIVVEIHDDVISEDLGSQPHSVMAEHEVGTDRNTQYLIATENQQPVNTVNETSERKEELVTIWEGVAVDKRVWNGRFKTFVERPVKSYGYGSRSDPEFIKDAAMALWGPEILSTHSISGKQSNANLKRNPNARIPGPPLPLFEVNAIIGALKRRVLMESKEPPTPLNTSAHDIPLAKRYSESRVKYVIGQKINSLLRSRKKPVYE